MTNLIGKTCQSISTRELDFPERTKLQNLLKCFLLLKLSQILRILSKFQFHYTDSSLQSPMAQQVKNPPAMQETCGLGRSPAGGNGNPLQHSCLGNPMDRRAWQATAQGATKRVGHTHKKKKKKKSWTRLNMNTF